MHFLKHNMSTKSNLSMWLKQSIPFQNLFFPCQFKFGHKNLIFVSVNIKCVAWQLQEILLWMWELSVVLFFKKFIWFDWIVIKLFLILIFKSNVRLFWLIGINNFFLYDEFVFAFFFIFFFLFIWQGLLLGLWNQKFTRELVHWNRTDQNIIRSGNG